VDSSIGIESNSVRIPPELYNTGTGIYRIKVYHPYIKTIQVCIHKGKSRIFSRKKHNHKKKQQKALLRRKPLFTYINRNKHNPFESRPIHIIINNIHNPIHKRETRERQVTSEKQETKERQETDD
jgi:hypothetical protein